MFAALRLSQQAQFDLRDPLARLINAAAMPRWAHGLSCMYARPTDTRPRHGQLRDRPHALQVFSGIRLSVPAFMMSPEWSVNKAGALDWRRHIEKHRGRSGRDHRESNG